MKENQWQYELYDFDFIYNYQVYTCSSNLISYNIELPMFANMYGISSLLDKVLMRYNNYKLATIDADRSKSLL